MRAEQSLSSLQETCLRVALLQTEASLLEAEEKRAKATIERLKKRVAGQAQSINELHSQLKTKEKVGEYEYESGSESDY